MKLKPDLMDKITEAYHKSVALKKVLIEEGTWPISAVDHTREEQDEMWERRKFSYSVDMLDATYEEVSETLRNDPEKRFYWEGGSDGCAYDFEITPRDIFNEHGINTEAEGSIRVKFADKKPNEIPRDMINANVINAVISDAVEMASRKEYIK